MSERTVLSMLKTAAERFPDRMYACKKTDEGWTGRTFSEIHEDAKACGASLIRIGVKKGTTAAVLAEGSPEWIISELGIIASGGISVPLSIRLLPEEIVFRLNHSEARAVFISRNQLPKLTSVLDHIENKDIIVICIDEDEDFIDQFERESGLVRGQTLLLLSEFIDDGRQLDFEHRMVNENELEADEDDVVTISYTSGTTGNPKGIMLTNRNYYVNCKDSVEAFDVPFTYQTLLILPCDHSFAHTVGIYAALLRGITLYFVDSRGGSMGTLRNIPKNILETEPVFLLSVPVLSGNFMKKIMGSIDEKGGLIRWLFTKGIAAGIAYNGNVHRKPFLLKRIWFWIPWKLVDLIVFKTVRKKAFGRKFQFFVGGGALLERSQQDFFYALGCPVFQGYGLTEAAPVISSNTRKFRKLGSSGKVLPSIECRIVDEEGRELHAGSKGEIIIRGENVMKGYFKNEKATQETLRNGWLHTGDLGYMDSDGFLVVTGREKALLISSDGEKYSPEEIEEAMMNSSRFVHQAIIWNDHEKYTSALIVPDTEAVNKYIDKNPGTSPEDVIALFSNVLRAFRTDKELKNRFPAVWVPTTFRLVTEPFSDKNFMVNSTGKLVRYKIVEAYKETIMRMYTDDGQNPVNEENLSACRTLFSFKEKSQAGAV